MTKLSWAISSHMNHFITRKSAIWSSKHRTKAHPSSAPIEAKSLKEPSATCLFSPSEQLCWLAHFLYAPLIINNHLIKGCVIGVRWLAGSSKIILVRIQGFNLGWPANKSLIQSLSLYSAKCLIKNNPKVAPCILKYLKNAESAYKSVIAHRIRVRIKSNGQLMKISHK